MGDLRDAMKDLRQSLERSAREAVTNEGPDANVNVAGRQNVVIARNVGGRGRTHGASAQQSVQIRQDGTTTSATVSTEKVDGN